MAYQQEVKDLKLGHVGSTFFTLLNSFFVKQVKGLQSVVIPE